MIIPGESQIDRVSVAASDIVWDDMDTMSPMSVSIGPGEYQLQFVGRFFNQPGLKVAFDDITLTEGICDVTGK